MMIFFVRRGEKTQKEYKESRFLPFKNFTLFSLCTYSLNREALPKGDARTRARTRNGTFCALPFAAFGRIDFAGVCLSVWSLFF